MTDRFIDDGVVKYTAIHTNANAPTHPLLNHLDHVRTQLFDLKLVGAYSNGIGYGNVSIRQDTGCIISGTATGSLRELGSSGYCQVQSFDIEKNIVHTFGPVNASSESMTHCAIYHAHHLIQCVLHVHHKDLWDALLENQYPSTAATVPYGTPEMAHSMASLVHQQNAPTGIMVMAGHEEGVITYGQTIQSAFEQIQLAYSQYIGQKGK